MHAAVRFAVDRNGQLRLLAVVAGRGILGAQGAAELHGAEAEAIAEMIGCTR